jgi:hypothetical protein
LATSSEIDVSIARQLLASTASMGAFGDDPADSAAAAGRVYEALWRALAPVVGDAGVRALLARSLRASASDFPCLTDVRLGMPSSEKGASIAAHIEARLREQDASIAADAAVRLYATFLTLLARLVGRAVTLQILRMAHPAIQVEEME